MNGDITWENRRLVTDKQVEFAKQPVEVKTAGNLLIILEEFVEYISELMKEKPEDVNM